MSFSFNAKANTKTEVIAQVLTELDKVVSAQPVHSKDREVPLAAVKSFLDLPPEPTADQVVSVSVSGSLGWSGTLDADDFALNQGGVSVSVGLQRR